MFRGRGVGHCLATELEAREEAGRAGAFWARRVLDLLVERAQTGSPARLASFPPP
jgi:hypothetical protein